MGGGLWLMAVGTKTAPATLSGTLSGNSAQGGTAGAAATSPDIPSGAGGEADGGGAYLNLASYILVSNSGITDNTATGGTSQNTDAASPGAAFGGGFYVLSFFANTSLTLKSSTVSDNGAIAGSPPVTDVAAEGGAVAGSFTNVQTTVVDNYKVIAGVKLTDNT